MRIIKGLLLLMLLADHGHAGPLSLDELLEAVRLENAQAKQLFAEREARFRQSRDQQQALLEEAEQQLADEQTRSTSLDRQYKENKQQLDTQNNELNQNKGSLGELHHVVQRIANDVDVIIDGSLVSAQKPDRDELLAGLANRKTVPEIQQLEALWTLILDELIESGKVVKFPARIIGSDGNETKKEAIRIGVFNAIADGAFLRNLPETGKLIEPGRQLPSRFTKMALELEQTQQDWVTFPIDPTRGAMLDLLVQTPKLKNRIEQAGLVGFLIIALALIGLLISLERFIVLTSTNRAVDAQLQQDKPGNNPLGRIMQVYQAHHTADSEVLEHRLDESILKELPRMQRGLGALALLATVAPLLGLLGTVTGIIETFQSITLYGTGDPRLMSGGISQALITTVMGLIAAIPLLLIHGFLSAKSNKLIQILDEKSLGYIAQLVEKNKD